MIKKQKNIFAKKEESFAQSIIDGIKSGDIAFLKPWKAGQLCLPYNAINGKTYQGTNIIRCLGVEKVDPRFMTFKQAKENNFSIRKGAKAISIFFFMPVSEDKLNEWIENGSKPEEKPFPTYKYFNVFSGTDIVDIEPIQQGEITFKTDEIAEEIISNSEVPIFHDMRDRAYYSVTDDEIHLPPKTQFPTAEYYYSTALHEIAHSTGAANRLNRDLSGAFGSESYAFEELIAQISSYMISCYLSLPHDPSHSFGYIQSWLKVFNEDHKKVLEVVKAANQVINYLMTPEMKKQAMKVNI